MSVVTIRSAALLGVEAFPVDVEVSTTNSLPGLKTIGRPDTTMREGKERVILALKNSELLEDKPSAVVNLAPADLRKTGACYELPIAIGLLVVKDRVPRAAVDRLFMVGELSLRGDARPIRGVLAMAAMAKRLGARALVVPEANAREVALVTGIAVIAVANLRDLAEGLRGERPLTPYVPSLQPVEPTARRELDLGEVRGQASARRALEVAAAGGHNLLLVGPPGSGKTMMARRLSGILPALDGDEALETTRVYSAAGMLRAGASLVRERPFRAPHHTISSSGLVGGYSPPRPGEVSLAHNGVLFLDELAEFSRASLEALRQPLEEGAIRVVRGGLSAAFPARAVLVGATNPCPCGYLGDPVRACTCALGAIDRYRGRLSGPLLDRIDLHVEVPRLPIADLMVHGPGESTEVVRERVARARAAQSGRFAATGARTNAQLHDRVVRELVVLDAESSRALEAAVVKLGFSPRAYVRILRVSRTIADLDGSPDVLLPHMLEAVQYRALDRRV